MTVSTITPFENTVHLSNTWLEQLARASGRDDLQHAYRMLRAVLMALRDRLTVEEATDLGAQLPMLIRGLYYEGYNPSKTPTKERHREAFFAHIAENLQEATDGSPEEAAKAVFELLNQHITAGQLTDVRAMLPKDVQSLWPID